MRDSVDVVEGCEYVCDLAIGANVAQQVTSKTNAANFIVKLDLLFLDRTYATQSRLEGGCRSPGVAASSRKFWGGSLTAGWLVAQRSSFWVSDEKRSKNCETYIGALYTYTHIPEEW